MTLELWQLIALYAIVAALVTFLGGLFHDDSGDAIMWGLFWPFIGAFLVMLSPLFALSCIEDLGAWCRKQIEADHD